MSAHGYHPQCGCADCCRAEHWHEQDFNDFQTWQQSLPDAQLAELYFDFIESLKPGRTLRRGGVSTFEDWAYEHRWP